MTKTVLTQPRGAVGSLGETNVVVLVPSFTTTTVDQVSNTVCRCVKWIVTITNTTNNNILVQEILAIDANIGLNYSRYNVIGDTIPHTISVSLSGSIIELTINNPSVDDYAVKMMRFEII